MKHTPMIVEPVTLSGQYIRLEPLAMSHFDQLWAIGRDAELWKWTPYQITTPDKMHAYIKAALDGQEIGTALPFITLWQATEQIVGSTRFGNIDAGNRHAEIGWTWIDRRWQRTPVNTEAKFLMLQHAFEEWRCLRVAFKADELDEKAQRAIERLGARREGVSRQHVIAESGRVRSSVYYSIVNDEWPQVKAHLQTLLARPWLPAA
jgi:RimJ/RimL family protein N-acetyltransferase